MKKNSLKADRRLFILATFFLIISFFAWGTFVGGGTEYAGASITSVSERRSTVKLFDGTKTGTNGTIALSDYTSNISYDPDFGFGKKDFYKQYDDAGSTLYSYTGALFNEPVDTSTYSTSFCVQENGQNKIKSLSPTSGAGLGTFPFYANSGMFIYRVYTDEDGATQVRYGDEDSDFAKLSTKYDDRFLAFYSYPVSTIGMHLGFTFAFSPELRAALEDRLLTVSFMPYVVTCAVADSPGLSAWQQISTASEYLVKDTVEDTCRISWWYATQNQSGTYSIGAAEAGMEIPADKTAIAYPKGSSALAVPNGSYTADSFLQVDIHDLSVGGTGISTFIAEVGIRVGVTPNSGITISNNSEYTISGLPEYVDAENREGAIYLKADEDAAYFLGTEAKFKSNYDRFYQCVLSPATSAFEYDKAYYDASGNYVAVSDDDIQNWASRYTAYRYISSATMLSAEDAYDENKTYWRALTYRSGLETVTKDSETYNYASPGSTLHFNIVVQQGGSVLYFEAGGVPTGEVQSGVMFRRLFPSKETYIIEYVLIDGDMEVNQAASPTGQKASIVVNSGGEGNLLQFKAVIRYTNSKTGVQKSFCEKLFRIYVDNEKPAEPVLERNSFYQTYISDSGAMQYYTGSDAESLERKDGNIVALNIGSVGGEYSKEDQPIMTDSALGVIADGNDFISAGGSNTTVYYRSTYYGTVLPNTDGDRISDGFTVPVNDANLREKGYLYTAPQATDDPSTDFINEKTGVYIGKYAYARHAGSDDSAELDYYKLLLSFAYYDDATMDVQYRKEGVWAIEFATYDNVGNYTYSEQKYFIQVDINEYSFGLQYFVGNVAGVDLDLEDVSFAYEKLSASGSLSEGGKYNNEPEPSANESYVGEINLHRGDRVVVRVSFVGSCYNNYALTSMKIGGGNSKDCTGFSYTVSNSLYRAVLYFEESSFSTSAGITTAPFTFEVNDVMCKTGNESSRVINLYFKKRAAISATNLRQKYTGADREIVTYSTYGGARIPATQVKIGTTYYKALTETAGDYTYGANIYDATYRDVSGQAALDSAMWASSYAKYYVKNYKYDPAGLIFNAKESYYYVASRYVLATDKAQAEYDSGNWADVYSNYYMLSESGERVNASTYYSDDLIYYYYKDGVYVDVNDIAALDDGDEIWVNTFPNYCYIANGGFVGAKSKFDREARYYVLQTDVYCDITPIVQAAKDVYTYRYQNYFYYSGYRYEPAPKPVTDDGTILSGGYDPNETYYTFDGDFYILNNYSSKVPTEALLNNYYFSVTTDEVFRAGVVYYKRLNDNGSNIPKHQGTYYVYSGVASNINYFGQAVFILRVEPGTPELNTLSALKNDPAGRYIQISYGDSLEKIDGKELFDGENRQTFSSYFKAEINNNIYLALSSDGVFGYYSIALDGSDPEYLRPSAGMHTIEVVFTPILGAYESGEPMPVYTERKVGGTTYYVFQRNTDYNTSTAYISVYVAPGTQVNFSLENAEDEGAFVYDYTGSQVVFKRASDRVGNEKQGYKVVSTFEDEYGNKLEEGGTGMDLTSYTVVSYAKISSPTVGVPEGSAFSSVLPVDAGWYCVMVSLLPKKTAQDTTGCNYAGTQYWYMHVLPISLTLSLSDMEYEYQYEAIPSVTFRQGDAAFLRTVPWEYRFYRRDKSLSAENNITDGFLLSDGELRIGETQKTPKNAGEYIVYVVVTDNNYTGSTYALYTIGKVSDGNGYVKKSWPSILQSAVSPEYNLTYGQPLSEIRLSSGNGFYVRYPTVSYLQSGALTTLKDVPGEFFVATENYADWRKEKDLPDTDLNRAQYVTEMKRFVPPAVRFDNGESYPYCICFAANDLVNYDFLYYGLAARESVAVRVGQAYLDWTNVRFEPITYETEISSRSVEEGVISIGKKVAYLYSSNGTVPTGLTQGEDYYVVVKSNVRYVYCYIDPDLYTLSVTVDGRSLLPVGNHNIKVAFATGSGNYSGTDYNCQLEVRQKELTVSYVGGVYSPVYGNHSEAELDKKMSFSGNLLAIGTLAGRYVYFDGSKYYQYSPSMKTYLVSLTKSGAFIDTANALPVGEYGVTYEITESNYKGTYDFQLVINKATLKVSRKPELSAEDAAAHLVYNADVVGVQDYFRNGLMTSAGESGETVVGTFVISEEHLTQKFGNAGTNLRIFFNFIPVDGNNYEDFVGTAGNNGYYDVTVRKVDVSDRMAISANPYVYALGHGEKGALTKDYLKSGYTAQGKTEETNTYAKFVRAYFDYNATVPTELVGENYEISIAGTASGAYVDAGSYLVTLSVTDECENYRGSVTTYLSVARDKAYIRVASDKTNEAVFYDNYFAEKSYSGVPQTVVAYTYNSNGVKVDSLTVLQSCYRQGSPVTSPTDIGSYDIRLSLASTNNYYLVAASYNAGTGVWRLDDAEASYVSANLTIGVNTDEISIDNLNQTYTQTRNLAVRMGSNNATCSVEFVALDGEGRETGERYTNIPTFAGTYAVHLMFDALQNNGYADDIVWKETLVIGKFTAKITCPNRINASFTGKARSLISAYTEPYGLGLIYAYRAIGSGDFIPCTAADIGRLNAGEYEINVQIDDRNYMGNKVVVLEMAPALLTMTSLPVFSEYTYHSESAPTVVRPGSAYCQGAGVDNISGTYSVDVDSIRYLNTGNHQVTYTFTPDCGDYAVTTGKVTLTVVAATYDMSLVTLWENGREIKLDEADYSVNYDGQRHVFTGKNVSYPTENIYDYAVGNKDFTVLISYSYYNASAATWVENAVPNAIGTYKVIATVSSKNYIGRKTWEKNLLVVQGIPTIGTMPTITRTFAVGDEIKSTDLVGGKAINIASGETITGTFSVPATLLAKANDNTVRVTFTPDAGNENFRAVSFDMTVRVIGKDVFAFYNGDDFEQKAQGTTVNGTDWSGEPTVGAACSKIFKPSFSRGGEIIGVSVPTHTCGVYMAIYPKNGRESLVYGASLADFAVAFRPVSDSCDVCREYVNKLNECGILSFASDEFVPSVGDKVEVKYVLRGDVGIDDIGIMNDMQGLISLGGILTKKTFIKSDLSVELVGFNGKTLQQADGYKLIIKKANGEEIDFGQTNVTFDYTEVISAQNGTVYVNMTAFDNKNYSLSGLPYALPMTPDAFILPENIYVGNTEKVYDGKVMTADDFVFDVRNVTIAARKDAYTIRVRDSRGLDSDGKDIGTYTVVVTVHDKENGYFGEKTFEATVVKRKLVAKDVTLSKTGDLFGSDTYRVAPSLFFGEEKIDDGDAEASFRKEGSTVFVSAPTDAGKYDLIYNVSSDKFYGEVMFTYIVAAQSVRMTPEQSSYNFIYGNEKNEGGRKIKLFFYNDRNESIGLDYKLYFVGERYSRTTVVPTDAGDYTVYVVPSDDNYRLLTDSFAYHITRRTLTLEEKPSLQTLSDGKGGVYHIKYGSSLRTLNTLFVGGRAVSDGIDMEGTFSVRESDADKVLAAGEHAFVAVFTPVDKNYAALETEMTVVVAKVDATVLFTGLQASYTGYGVGGSIAYTVTPKVDVSITFVSMSDGSECASPIYAGNYALRVTTTNANYNIITMATPSAYGSSVTVAGDDMLGAPVFVVNKASVRSFVKPTAIPVSVGESLEKSSLSGGYVYYYGFNSAVSGNFVFVSSALAFRNAGTYAVDYKFVPTDETDYEAMYGTVDIVVKKGMATVSVDELSATAVYGTPADFNKLVFVTKPANLAVKFETVYRGVTYKNGDIMPANTYFFTCYVEDDNYVSEETEFRFVVNKKKIDMDFIDESGVPITSISPKYAKEVNLAVQLYDSNDTSGKETYLLKDADGIYNNIQYYFVARETEQFTYESNLRPTKIGSYTVTATLVHDNYTAVATATYRITKGEVEQIIFEENSLTCEYGKVAPPIVTTVPAGVHYYIIYAGYEKTMPTDINSYNITVYIDDENYAATQINNTFRIVPKTISVTDIKVKDKLYNGTPTVDIEAKLSGVLYNDEVFLTLTAETADGSAAVGKHLVSVTSYKLSGLKAQNYVLTEPVCNETITIFDNVIYSSTDSSYVSTQAGFAVGTEVSFYKVASKENQSSAFTRSLGVNATVVGYTFTVNGEPTIMANQYKIYLEIPEEYRNQDFKIEATGGLAEQTVAFTREGNYISFYASTTSGEVVFSRAELKYTYIVIGVAAGFFLIGLILILILNPLQKRSALGNNGARRAAIGRIKKGF